MEKQIDLSIITINYNGLADTLELIDSIEKQNWNFGYEIIVIDNGSKENEAKLILDKYPKLIVVRSEENLGFAGGNNRAMEEASGEFLFFLNNDTLLADNCEGEMVSMMSFLRKHRHIGGLSPKIKFTQGNRLQFAGATEISRITLRNRQIGYNEIDEGQYEIREAIPYMHGAAMLIPQSVIRKVGKMPECYFLYYEEIDWSERIRKHFELCYFPNFTIYHKESNSVGENSPLKTFYLSRNRLLFAYRNRQGVTLCLSMAYLLLMALPQKICEYVAQRRMDKASAVWNGVVSFFRIPNKMQ